MNISFLQYWLEPGGIMKNIIITFGFYLLGSLFGLFAVGHDQDSAVPIFIALFAIVTSPILLAIALSRSFSSWGLSFKGIVAGLLSVALGYALLLLIYGNYK